MPVPPVSIFFQAAVQSLWLIFVLEDVPGDVPVWPVLVCAAATPLSSRPEKRTADTVNFMPTLLLLVPNVVALKRVTGWAVPTLSAPALVRYRTELQSKQTNLPLAHSDMARCLPNGVLSFASGPH